MDKKKKGIVKGLSDDVYLDWKSTNAYSLGKGAQGMGRALMSSDITNYFMTNILSINPIIAANIRLWCGIFDAFNDLFAGTWVDRTRRSSGKMRPFILIAPFIAAIFSVLFFIYIGALTMPIKIALSVFALVGWDLAFSCYDVSLNALPLSMTKNSVERTKLFGISSIFNSILAFLPLGLLQLVIFVPAFEKHENYFYLAVAITISLLTVILSRFTYTETREIIKPRSEKPSLKHCFKYLLKNKPLFMLFTANLLSVSVAVSSALQMYFTVDLMGNAKYKLLMLIATVPSIFFAGIFIPKLIEVLGSKTNFKMLYIGCCIIAAVIHLLTFVTTKSVLLERQDGAELPVAIAVYILTLCSLAAFPAECRKVLSKEMEAQSVDYVEWIYGTRLEGTMMSLMSMSEKLVGTLASVLALFILGLSNYATHDTFASVSQTDEAKLTLLLCFTIVPMVGSLLMIVPMIFYDIKGDEHDKMLLDIKRRIVKGDYIKRSSMTDLFAGMTEEEIAKLTAAMPHFYKIQNMGLATLDAKSLYDLTVETAELDSNAVFTAGPLDIEPNVDSEKNYITGSAQESAPQDSTEN